MLWRKIRWDVINVRGALNNEVVSKDFGKVYFLSINGLKQVWEVLRTNNFNNNKKYFTWISAWHRFKKKFAVQFQLFAHFQNFFK